MKKMVLGVVCAVVAMAMTGCGRSPSKVAVKFAEAIIEREADDALDLFDTTIMSEKEIKDKKEEFENAGKKIDDNKLEAEALGEIINVPSEVAGYTLKNGKKYTGESAQVTVQFVKGKDKKDYGMNVKLVKVDGSWKVEDYGPARDL